MGVNGFYKVHCKSTHHHPPTFNPSYHQHSTFITQHPSPNIQPLISSTLNIHHPTPTTQHPTPNTQHSTPHIIIIQHPSPITQHSIPHIIITQHPSPNTHHPTFNPTHHQHPTSNTHHPTFNPINFIISFFLCKFAVK